jgi:hypothetical protein
MKQKTLKANTKKNKTRKESGLKQEEKEEDIKLKSASEEIKINEPEKPNQNQYWELVNKYFQLKTKYEKETQKLITSLEKDSKIKENIKRLVTPCVNCRRNVGSLFKTRRAQRDGTSGRVFSVKCGDPVDPCSLIISFLIPNLNDFNSIFKSDNFKIEKYKTEIISCKNDLVFQYADEEPIMERFAMLKEKLNHILNDNSYALDIYSTIIKKPELRDQSVHIAEYNRLMNEYKKTKSQNLLQEAIQLYISEIRPAGKKNMKITYSQNSVENNDEYRLIQKEIPPSHLEIIGRFPLIYEDLNIYIISNETDNKTTQLKKTFKKIMIIPATEARNSDSE